MTTVDPPEAELAYEHLLGLADPLSSLVAEQGPIDFHRPTLAVEVADPLSGLTLHVIGQKISRFSALAVFQRLQQLFGGTIDPVQLASASEQNLRDVGLSYAKARALRELGEEVRSGALDFAALAELDDRGVERRLVELRGVGPWSAQVFMLRDLRRPDVFPAGDIGLRTAIAALDRLPATPAIAAVAERSLAWRPYRSYAAAYLWRSYAKAQSLKRTAPAG